MIGFRECARQLAANTTLGASLRQQYSFPNTTNTSALITTAGCLALCGDGNDHYPWDISASTITTWLLPVIGILLQAPFSNSFVRNVLAIIRWIGSPIASLACILRDIKTSGRAAVLVDMSVQYDEFPGRDDSFADVRDGLWALVIMGDFETVRGDGEGGLEGLLRIALFAEDLKLSSGEMLKDVRREVVQELREMRRKGIVPVFVSTMWFLFAFGLSIQTAFANLGDNSASHDLALGCLLSWFPVLTLCSIIDHSPQDAKATRKKLNNLIGRVRDTLQDTRNRESFLDSLRSPQEQDLEKWVLDIVGSTQDFNELFLDYYGQGQIRWHINIPRRILRDIESSNAVKSGRNWLKNDEFSRIELIIGRKNFSDNHHDISQVLGASFIVCGGFGGAFTLSYFTPRVYLGCRSRGYLIFFIASLGLQILELTITAMALHYHNERQSVSDIPTRSHQNANYARLKASTRKVFTVAWELLTHLGRKIERKFLPPSLQTGNKLRKKSSALCSSAQSIFWQTSLERKLEMLLFRTLEAASFAWLVYIVLAQTFGFYNNCVCATRPPGYVDIGSDSQFQGERILNYWIAGTVISSTSMTVALLYVTVEWCQQSFLSTENYDSAMSGLHVTRAYRKLTYPFRLVFRTITRTILKICEYLPGLLGLPCDIHQGLLWRPHTSMSTSAFLADNDSHEQLSPPPSRSYIELSDYSTGDLADIFAEIQVTPAK